VKRYSVNFSIVASILAVFCALAHSNAQIVYVDAAEGASGNTFATGGALADTGWLNPDRGADSDDGQWKKRAFANGGTIFQSRTERAGKQSELTTHISGLADGWYNIWVFFWDASSSDQSVSPNQWNISTGLASGSLNTYSFDGLGDKATLVAASTLSFAAVPMVKDGDRIMYGVNIGQATVSGGSAIKVFINGLHTGSDDRTWYDGVGYEALQNPNDTVTSKGVTFSDWISSFTGLSGSRALNADADADGIQNGIENYFGTHPGKPSQGLTIVNVSSNTFTFTHPLNNSPASDLTALYRWSKDGTDFYVDGASHQGTTVNFSQGNPLNGVVNVTGNIKGTMIDRLFVDVAVMPK